jgi:sortase (surface protein transpeptidase)
MSVPPRPVGGTAATDPATSGSASGGPAQAAVTSSSPSSHATASSRPTTPLLLEVPAIALKAAITAYTPDEVAADGGAVKPPTLFSVSWWTGGGNPGPAARNTVYLYGHTWKEPAVFNRIKELRVGDRVVVTTTGGRLVYVVDGSFTVSKPDLVTTARVTEATAGRLLLIGCYRATGHEAHTTANIVVTTHLLRS